MSRSVKKTPPHPEKAKYMLSKKTKLEWALTKWDDVGLWLSSKNIAIRTLSHECKRKELYLTFN